MAHHITPKDAFIAEIATYQPLESAAELFVRDRLRVSEHKKKETLLSIGEVNDRLHFVHKGLARGYYSVKDEDGEKLKATSLLAAESHFIISPLSFLKQQPSREGVELLENSTLVSISYQDLQILYDASPAANAIRALVTERYLIYYAERDRAFKFTTGEQRYRWFLANRPELGNNRVLYKDIASYLNLAEKSFARIWKAMNR